MFEMDDDEDHDAAEKALTAFHNKCLVKAQLVGRISAYNQLLNAFADTETEEYEYIQGLADVNANFLANFDTWYETKFLARMAMMSQTIGKAQ